MGLKIKKKRYSYTRTFCLKSDKHAELQKGLAVTLRIIFQNTYTQKKTLCVYILNIYLAVKEPDSDIKCKKNYKIITKISIKIIFQAVNATHLQLKVT